MWKSVVSKSSVETSVTWSGTGFGLKRKSACVSTNTCSLHALYQGSEVILVTFHKARLLSVLRSINHKGAHWSSTLLVYITF